MPCWPVGTARNLQRTQGDMGTGHRNWVVMDVGLKLLCENARAVSLGKTI